MAGKCARTVTLAEPDSWSFRLVVQDAKRISAHYCERDEDERDKSESTDEPTTASSRRWDRQPAQRCYRDVPVAGGRSGISFWGSLKRSCNSRLWRVIAEDRCDGEMRSTTGRLS